MIKKSILFSIILTFISCKHDFKLSEVFNFGSSDSLHYRMDSFVKIYPGQEKNSDYTYVAFYYPVYVGNEKSKDDFLNSEIQNMMVVKDYFAENETLTKEEFTEKFFKDYGESLKDYPDISIPHSFEISINPIGRYKNIVSFHHLTYMFSGGAHPNTVISFDNFDIDKKQRVITDNLIDISNEKLKKIALENFKSHQAIEKDSSLTIMGHFWGSEDHKEGEFYLNQNLGFEKDSVIWLYNSYEIACYAVGQSVIKLPIKTVEEFIKK